MAGFEDDKHPRDDKGRFSGGGRALDAWAKASPTSQRLGLLKPPLTVKEKYKAPEGKRSKMIDRPVSTLKLEGYSKAEDPAKGKVEGRQRDIEIPLVRKNESYIASTGLLDVQPTEVGLGLSYRAPDLYRRMRARGDVLSEKRKLVEKDAFKAQEACSKITKANFEWRQEGTNGQPEIKSDAPPKVKRAWEAAVAKRDKAFQALASTEDAYAVHRVMERGLYEMAKNLKSGAKIEYSHSPDEGWENIHIVQPSGDPKYPGEKEFSMEIQPGKSEVQRVSKMGVEWKIAASTSPPGSPSYLKGSGGTMSSQNPTIHITTQFPTTTRGKEHPDSKDEVYPSGYLAQSFFDHAGGHINSFFKDRISSEQEEESDRFAAAHPNGTGIEKMGDGKPGVLWKPTGKTLADYER